MGLAFGVCALLTVSGVRRAGRMSRRMYLRYALLFPLMIVFCLPRMHERYFDLADAMAIAAAAEDRRMTPAAGLIALASLGSYWETALPLSACAWMMFAAGIWTIGHTQREENML